MYRASKLLCQQHKNIKLYNLCSIYIYSIHSIIIYIIYTPHTQHIQDIHIYIYAM